MDIRHVVWLSLPYLSKHTLWLVPPIEAKVRIPGMTGYFQSLLIHALDFRTLINHWNSRWI